MSENGNESNHVTQTAQLEIKKDTAYEIIIILWAIIKKFI